MRPHLQQHMEAAHMKNMNVAIAGLAIVAVLGAAAFFYSGWNERAFIDPSNRDLVVRGKAIYANRCASCHGANLEGQPEWRKRRPNGRLPAPPHDATGHTWHHPDAVLVDIIKNGLVPGRTAPDNYESDMPPYGALLSDADIVAVLAYIKSTWPAEALEAQKNVTLQRD
jgi:S-disulfanyl-L-cysteine oxidoreductase SoxD